MLEVGQAIIELRLEQQRLPQEPRLRRTHRLAPGDPPDGPGADPAVPATRAEQPSARPARGEPGDRWRHGRRLEPRAPQFDTLAAATGAQLPALHSQRPARPAIAPGPGKETREPVEKAAAQKATGILLPIRRLASSVLTESICRSLSQLKQSQQPKLTPVELRLRNLIADLLTQPCLSSCTGDLSACLPTDRTH